MNTMRRSLACALLALSVLAVPAHAADQVLCRNGASGTQSCPVPLSTANIPSLDAAKITSGALTRARGGLGADVSALSTGLLAQTASNTWAVRTLTGTTEVVVGNGNGVSGNPTVSMGATLNDKLLNYAPASSAVSLAIRNNSGTSIERTYTKGTGGWYFTINASTSDGTTWTKDDTAAPSTVMSLTGTAGAPVFRLMFENVGANASWSSPTRSMKWSGTSGWSVTTGNTQQSAWTGGFIKGCVSGNVIHFPVQWPVPFDATPTNISFGTVTSTGVNTASAAMGTFDATGGDVQITCNATGDAYWIGKISVGS